MRPIWFKNHVAYTMAKYGMSMCVLGMAEEFREQVCVLVWILKFVILIVA